MEFWELINIGEYDVFLIDIQMDKVFKFPIKLGFLTFNYPFRKTRFSLTGFLFISISSK